MRISDEQVKKVLESAAVSTDRATDADEAIRTDDAELIAEVLDAVRKMGDREDFVERLKAELAAGTYRPSGEEIAEAMIRRAIADRVR